MFNHVPDGYECPFCRLVSGHGDHISSPEDFVRRNGLATALVSPRWWPNNKGHVLVVPDTHHENLYDLPRQAGHAVHDLVQEIATAIRSTYDCDGTSTRQHNEPAGGQDVWHYHVHVYPRYTGDAFYRSPSIGGFVSYEEKAPYVYRLREFFAAQP